MCEAKEPNHKIVNREVSNETLRNIIRLLLRIIREQRRLQSSICKCKQDRNGQ